MATKPDFRPMPVHKVIYHPAMITAQGAVYRGALCLAVAYWSAQCRDVADDNTTLATLMHMPNGHVAAMRKALLDTFAELATILKADWEAGNQKAANIRRSTSNAGKALQAQKRAARTALETKSPTIIPPSPALATPLETEMRRQIQRNSAFKNTQDGTRLSDGSGVGGKLPIAPDRAA